MLAPPPAEQNCSSRRPQQRGPTWPNQGTPIPTGWFVGRLFMGNPSLQMIMPWDDIYWPVVCILLDEFSWSDGFKDAYIQWQPMMNSDCWLFDHHAPTTTSKYSMIYVPLKSPKYGKGVFFTKGRVFTFCIFDDPYPRSYSKNRGQPGSRYIYMCVNTFIYFPI